jgi:glycosyltransferase involved in cell wall biosynthesis
MVRLMSRWVDLVVVVTGDQTGAWIERGYPRDRVAVVSNGVETPMVPESKATIRRDLKISDDAIVAALVARLRPEKRVADFVDAVRRVRESDDQVIALIVGDGPDRAAIERAGDGDSAIRLLGHRDDVPRVLKAADLLVLSSEYEAAPMVILEAMATGLPVIATNVGAVREMVEDGETGMLVPPMAPGQIAAKLAHLAGDVRLRDAMGAAGMQRQRERWDAEAMIDGYAKIIGRYDRAIRTPASVGLGPPPRADR